VALNCSRVNGGGGGATGVTPGDSCVTRRDSCLLSLSHNAARRRNAMQRREQPSDKFTAGL